MTDFLENNTNEVARGIKVKYTINDVDYQNKYPIKSSEDQDIINAIIFLIADYRISNFGVELGNPFIINKSKLWNKDDLLDDLEDKINTILNRNKKLNLTK